jgi:hypothetical protein
LLCTRDARALALAGLCHDLDLQDDSAYSHHILPKPFDLVEVEVAYPDVNQ